MSKIVNALRAIHPNCWVKNMGYKFGKVTFVVYSDLNGVVIGRGNTAKNACANALQNCGS